MEPSGITAPVKSALNKFVSLRFAPEKSTNVKSAKLSFA
jgi:hypothetical protein